MRRLVKYLIPFSLLTLQCTKNSTEPGREFFTVSGYVYHQGNIAPKISVNIDQDPYFATQTDRNGYFEIRDVEKGKHELKFSKLFAEGNFSERVVYLNVSQDVFLNSLLLPKKVLLHESEVVSSTSLILKWNSTDAEDFREYKLYMHNSSGLDETTGTLIHVSTSIIDTTFQINDLKPLSTYYFRVFVMNEFGRLGGSNIVSVKTANLNVIENGDFEVFKAATNFPDKWRALVNPAYFVMDRTAPQSGVIAVRSNIQKDAGYLIQDIPFSQIELGKRYRLRYWAKHDSLGSNAEFSVFFSDKDGKWFLLVSTMRGPKSANLSWQEFEYEVVFPVELSTPSIPLVFYFESYVNDTLKVWVDNVSLMRTE